VAQKSRLIWSDSISLVFFPALSGHANSTAAHYAHALTLAMVFAAILAALAEGLLFFLPRTAPSTGLSSAGNDSFERPKWFLERLTGLARLQALCVKVGRSETTVIMAADRSDQAGERPLAAVSERPKAEGSWRY
jgi:hypothetical protein